MSLNFSERGLQRDAYPLQSQERMATCDIDHCYLGIWWDLLCKSLYAHQPMSMALGITGIRITTHWQGENQSLAEFKRCGQQLKKYTFYAYDVKYLKESDRLCKSRTGLNPRRDKEKKPTKTEGALASIIGIHCLKNTQPGNTASVLTVGK